MGGVGLGDSECLEQHTSLGVGSPWAGNARRYRFYDTTVGTHHSAKSSSKASCPSTNATDAENSYHLE